MMRQQEHGASMADDEVTAYLEQIGEIRLAAGALAAELTSDQLNWQPSPTRWSVGQCLEHLTMSLRLYREPLDVMLLEARQRQARGLPAYREGWFTRWFVRSMEPPPKLRVRTFAKANPSGGLDPSRVLPEFDAVHGALADLVAGAAGVGLRHGRGASPFSRLITFTLNQAIAVNLAHARRHLWQARQVRQSPSFPS